MESRKWSVSLKNRLLENRDMPKSVARTAADLNGGLLAAAIAREEEQLISDSQVGEQQIRRRRGHPRIGRWPGNGKHRHTSRGFRGASAVNMLHEKHRRHTTGWRMDRLSTARLTGGRRTSVRIGTDRNDHDEYDRCERCERDRRYASH